MSTKEIVKLNYTDNIKPDAIKKTDRKKLWRLSKDIRKIVDRVDSDATQKQQSS